MAGLGDFLQGALGGGLGGSTYGPGGTLVGGLLGGLGGLFGSGGTNDDRARQLKLYEEMSRGGPQLGPAAQSKYSDFRDNQRNYIGNLEAMAAGRGPSLATEQLKAATDRNIKQQQGMAQSGIGNAAAAASSAMNNTAALGMQAAQDSGQQRIQEQLNAMNLLGINLHGARGADEDMNRFNASQQNQMAQAGYQGQLDNNRLRAMILGGMSGNAGPSTGERILAGGAGMYGQGQQMKILANQGKR